jgi:hypothetical protein
VCAFEPPRVRGDVENGDTLNVCKIRTKITVLSPKIQKNKITQTDLCPHDLAEIGKACTSMAATDNDIIPGHMQPAHTQGFLNLSSKRFAGTDLSFTTTNCKILPKMEGFVKILYEFRDNFWKSRKNNKKTHFLNVYKNRSKI